MCITASGQRIIAACEDIVNIYDAITFVLRQSLHAPETVTEIKVSPDGSILFFAHTFSMTMWDVQTGGLIHTFTNQSKINAIAVSKILIACGLSDGFIKFWNIHTKKKGKSFGNSQPVVTMCWLSPRELAVATQSTLYIRDIIIGETIGRFSVPGHVWGMVYLEEENEFLVGVSQASSRVGQKSFFIKCKQRRLQPEDVECLRWRFMHHGESPTHSGQLSSPTLVGKEVVCISPADGVQLFNIGSYRWTNRQPLLSAATSVVVSLNGNLVVQTEDSIQIFSADILTTQSGEVRNDVGASHIYPLGEKHIIRVLQSTQHIALLQLRTLQELHPRHNASLLTSLLANRSRVPFSHGQIARLSVSAILEAWQSGSPLPEWSEDKTTEEDAPLSGLSPERTRSVTLYNSPRRELRVEDVETGITLARLPIKHDDFEMGEVYDLAFDSETRFCLKVDGPGWHGQIPHEIIPSPSGRYQYTITKGEPIPLSEPQATSTSPYTLDTNREWVTDARSRKICWISPGDVRRGDGGHFWAGLSLVMVGDDGVVRKLTFKEPDH